MEGESTTVIETPVVTPETPIVPQTPVAEGERPRDDKGRFTPAKIREAAGLPPEEEPAVVPVTPETPAAPIVPVVSTLEDDLKAIEAVAVDGTVPAVTPTVAPTSQAPAPSLSQEAAQLHQWASNPQSAQQAVSAAYQWNRLDQQLNQGNVGAVVEMLSPAAQAALVDHIYRQNAQTFAQRYADEANGVQRDPRLDQALTAIQQLQQRIDQEQAARNQAQQQYQNQQQLQQTAVKLQTAIDSMFDAVKMKDSPNRVFLEAALQKNLQANPQAMQAIRNGQFGHVRGEFQNIWKQWYASTPMSPVPAPAPAPSAQLMSAPQGTASVQTAPSVDDEAVKEGRLTTGWWASKKGRLKSLVG